MAITNAEPAKPLSTLADRPRNGRGAAALEGKPLKWLRDQIKARGLSSVAFDLGFARSTVASAAGGCELRMATRTLLTDLINNRIAATPAR